jgi:hypothetical protein
MAIKKTAVKRKLKRKKLRYRKVVFKFTEGQKKRIDRYCLFHNTTLKRLIKKSIQEYIEQHGGDVPDDEPVSKNQLKLFDLEQVDKGGFQIGLFDADVIK